MAEPKNPFDFGTGSIDKDQWQRDIDNEQDAFIARYLNATNKKRGLLLRQAFQDLRKRIANGDMLNRTADGLYQFGSALLREDADMKEAYQRALGFMGDLARRQIQAPPAEPEKKKYSSKTLNDRFIRYFNPSGSQESFTSLWNSYDNDKRKLQLKDFLNSELSNLEKNYLDVEDYDSMDNLKTRINEFLSDPSLTNLNRLGFNRNYLSLLQTEEDEESKPKSEKEQIALELLDLTEQYLLEQSKQALEGLKHSLLGTLNFSSNLNFGSDFLNYLNLYFKEKLGYTLANPYIRRGTYYEEDEKDDKGNVVFHNRPYRTNRNFGQNDRLFDVILSQYANNYLKKYLGELNDYFKDFGTRYESLYNENQGLLMDNLSKLFATYKGNGVANWEKIFTKINDGYLINGSLDDYGNYAILTPSGIEKRNRYRDSLASHKEGGVIKAQNGFEFDVRDYHTVQLPNQSDSEQSVNSELKNSEKMDFGDIANIAGPLALDITSMLTANGIGIGTAISAGSGLASTVLQGINDWDNNNVWGSLGSIGANLIADGVGIIPGLGISGKVGKIATGLTKHAKYLGYVFNTIGAKDASLVLYKGVKNGFNLSPDEWKTLLYGLAGVAQGAAGVKRANRTNLKRGAATQQVYNSTNKKGETYPVAVGIGDATPGKTGKSRYIANKNDILKVREKTLTPDWSGSMDRSFVKIMQQPRSSVILHPWESLNNPFRNPFSLEKSRNKFNSFAELWRKRKGKPSNTTETPSEKYGGILKALRNGGIIKADDGIKFPSLKGYATDTDWANLNFGTNRNHSYADNGFSNRESGGLGWSRGLYNNGADGDLYLDLNSARLAQYNYYTFDNGKNIFGDVLNYYNTWKAANPDGNYQTFILDYNSKVEELRNLNKKKLNTTFNSSGWTYFNDLFHKLYLNYGKTYINKDGKEEIYDDWSDKLKDFFGESTARRVPNTFDDNTQFADLRNGLLNDKDLKSRVGIDNEGKLFMYDQSNDGITEVSGKQKDPSTAVDEESGKSTTYNTEFKNPIDPTLGIIATQTAASLAGNKNVFGNLLNEMPQAPLRDPIDRKLAIVGWLEQLKLGQNQLADLRRIQLMLQGVDLQTNFATALETDRVGRDIMNDKLMKDSGRQFETAQKSWNLDNEDTLYNVGVGDANRRAIADRARMMAQIRAAWRSGDANTKMKAISDTGNWLKLKYQREQDIVDLARKEQLGTRELFMENLLLQNPNYEALKTEYETTKDANRKKEIAAEILKMKVEVLRKAPSDWALKIYSIFHTPGFGGGTKEVLAKDGTKLEVAKLKARSKDNDRYVSMIKDLRTTRYRHRRR